MTESILREERAIQEAIERITAQNGSQAAQYVQDLLDKRPENVSAAESASYARCVCRFLLHRKMKAHFVALLAKNVVIRNAIFGQLNTYPYSLVFLLQRILRTNNLPLIQEVLTLLEQNPFRESAPNGGASHWNMHFLIAEATRDAAEYLSLQPEVEKLLKQFR